MVSQQHQRNKNAQERHLSRQIASSYLLHFKTILSIFKNKQLHISKHFTKLKKKLKIQNIFVYILTNENHYKDCLNNGLFYKILSKPHKEQFQNKKKVIQQVTKSPWKTMDEKGANTFPFHNLPPELKKTSQRSFLFFFTFPFG